MSCDKLVRLAYFDAIGEVETCKCEKTPNIPNFDSVRDAVRFCQRAKEYNIHNCIDEVRNFCAELVDDPNPSDG